MKFEQLFRMENSLEEPVESCYIGTYTKAAGQGIALLEYDPHSKRISAPKTVGC